MFDIDEEKINMSCPGCGFKNPTTFKQIKKGFIICNGCKRTIKLIDKNGSVRKTTENIRKETTKIKKSLKKLNKDLNIKI